MSKVRKADIDTSKSGMFGTYGDFQIAPQSTTKSHSSKFEVFDMKRKMSQCVSYTDHEELYKSVNYPNDT